MKTIKQNLKEQATTIRQMKQDISSGMRKGEYRGNSQSTLCNLKEIYRYEHIAYCMIRGREYKEIENKTRPGNEIDLSRLTRTMDKMKSELFDRTPKEELQDA